MRRRRDERMAAVGSVCRRLLCNNLAVCCSVGAQLGNSYEEERRRTTDERGGGGARGVLEAGREAATWRGRARERASLSLTTALGRVDWPSRGCRLQ